MDWLSLAQRPEECTYWAGQGSRLRLDERHTASCEGQADEPSSRGLQVVLMEGPKTFAEKCLGGACLRARASRDSVRRMPGGPVRTNAAFLLALSVGKSRTTGHGRSKHGSRKISPRGWAPSIRGDSMRTLPCLTHRIRVEQKPFRWQRHNSALTLYEDIQVLVVRIAVSTCLQYGASVCNWSSGLGQALLASATKKVYLETRRSLTSGPCAAHDGPPLSESDDDAWLASSFALLPSSLCDFLRSCKTLSLPNNKRLCKVRSSTRPCHFRGFKEPKHQTSNTK